MEKNKKEQEKNLKNAGEVKDAYEPEEEKNLTIDDIENAPDDLDELFSEPPLLELDFDEEPTDEEMMKYLNDTAKLVQLGMLGHQYTLGGEVDCVGLAKQMSDTYRKKNADYGDSFSASIDRYGALAAHVRMCDKVNRLQSWVVRKQTAQVKDESIADTFLDLACYAVMRLVYIEMKSSEQEEE